MKKIIFFFFWCITFIYASNINEIEPNNIWRQATEININDTGVGSLNWRNDHIDWWKFTPTKSGVLTIYTTRATKDIDAELYSKYLVDYDYKHNNNIYMQIYVQANKTYYLSLFLNQRARTDYNLHFSFFPTKNTATFHPIFNVNLNGKLNVIGNHNICYTNDGEHCLNPGNADNNNIYQKYINVDQNAIDNGYINSSEADLNLTIGDNIVKAYLFWQGRIRTNNPNNDNSVKNANKVEFKSPTSNAYVEIDANQTAFNWYYGSDGVFDYGAYADVTQYVQKSGQYYVANLQVSKGYNTGGGWSLVVITQNPKDKFKKIVVYQGFQAIYNAEDYPSSVTQTLNDFYTPISGPVNASFILFANETDKDLGDSITLTDKNGNKHYLKNDLNPYNNVLNCTISKFGKNVINRNPNFENTLGTDIDKFNVSNIFDNSQTETNIKVNSNGDRVFLEMFGISVQLYVPKVCYYDFNLYDQNDNLITSDTKLFAGDKIKVKYKIKNDENEIAKNVYIIYPFDNNITKYIQNSTDIKNVLENNYTHFDDNSSNKNLSVYVDNKALTIGILGDSNNNFLPYNTNKNYNAGIEFNVTLQKEGNLSFVFYTDYNYSIGNQNYSYNGVLPKCSEFENNYNIYNPVSGGFNVVHYQPNINNDPVNVNDSINALYTQIVNQDFNVTVVKLKDDNQTIDKNYKGIVEVDLIKNPTNENECKNNVSLWHKYLIFDNNIPKLNVIYNKANKNLRFRIKYFTDRYGNVFRFNNANCLTSTSSCVFGMLESRVYPANVCKPNDHNDPRCICYDECKGNVDINQCLKCIFGSSLVKSICSRDNFAIKPDKFIITNIPKKKIKAGKEFNLTIKALDYKGNPIKDYNETLTLKGISSPSLEYNDTNFSKGCMAGILNGKNLQFKNGVANITLNYSEVGDLNFTVKEINGSEFAKVDEKDDTNSQLFITPASIQLTFIPDHFNMEANYINFNHSQFTYISNDLNMSSILDVNITAKNEQNETTKNYNSKCYAQNSDLNISYGSVPSKLTKILVKENNNETNITIPNQIDLKFTKDIFTTDHNGSAQLDLKINFKRNPRVPINEFNFTLEDINVSDEDNIIGTKKLDENATFRYGRIDASNVGGYSKELNTTYKYEYWTNDGWQLNKDHNSSFGDVNESKSYHPFITMDINHNIEKAVENITLSTTHALPYSTKIHLAIPNWLWYNPLAESYKVPSATNQNCLTHPCQSVTFNKISSGWGGIGKNNVKSSETNRTAEINASLKKVKANKSEVKRLNW